MKIKSNQPRVQSSTSSIVGRPESYIDDSGPLDSVEVREAPRTTHYGKRAYEKSATDHPRRQRAIASYQSAIDLKHQVETHAPFYYEELGDEEGPRGQERGPATPPPHSPQESLMPIRHRPTRFFPGPSGEREGVSAIRPVRSVRFQRILPSYEMSTAETREEGLGPHLEPSETRALMPHRKR